MASLATGFDSPDRVIGHKLVRPMTGSEEANAILGVMFAFLLGGIPLTLYALSAAAAWP